MVYEKNTIYVLGTSKISKNDPIAALYDILFIGIILERDSGKIIDSTCNMVRDVTSDFIKSILVGYQLLDDIDEIIDEIKDRFYGMAQKAVIAAIKDARNKYMMIRNQ
ncbi:DUF3870 domain-containing protein [Crassaminicella thermophila]|uniref:DUF3870 domain-containing protein n=1 Tax=Crassaminicella thermophila TaxID=2599308 RepID=A0A5C0SJ12_CRATE|nr:DUF3870 domain-containing protein [Crassaminicella thermophila]QEK12939.1 DUF3870 domain-containing protein [Crassaminicella thermophila]